MSVSLEALAMAGVDYGECNISVEKWEKHHSSRTPHHLLYNPKRAKSLLRFFSLSQRKKVWNVDYDGDDDDDEVKIDVFGSVYDLEVKKKEPMRNGFHMFVKKVAEKISNIFNKIARRKDSGRINVI